MGAERRQAQSHQREHAQVSQLLRGEDGAGHQGEARRQCRGAHAGLRGHVRALPGSAAVPIVHCQTVPAGRQVRPVPQQSDAHLQQPQLRFHVPEARELRGARRHSRARGEVGLCAADDVREAVRQSLVPGQGPDRVPHSVVIQIRECEQSVAHYGDPH